MGANSIVCACGRTDEHTALSRGAAQLQRKRPCSRERVRDRWLAAAQWAQANGRPRMAAGYRMQAAVS